MLVTAFVWAARLPEELDQVMYPTIYQRSDVSHQRSLDCEFTIPHLTLIAYLGSLPTLYIQASLPEIDLQFVDNVD